MYQEVVSTGSGDCVFEFLSGRSEGSDRSGNDCGTCFCELGSDESDSSEVERFSLGRDGGVFVGCGRVGVVRVKLITEEKGDGSTTVLL